MLVVLGVEVRWGFSLACRADANARGFGVRKTGAVVGVGSGRVVVAGGVDEDVGVGPAVIACDNFDGARGPCNRKNQQKFTFRSRIKLPRKCRQHVE